MATGRSAVYKRSMGILLSLLAGLFAVPLAAAQGGYKTEKFPEFGLTLKRARDYEQVPLPPDEDLIVLYWVEQPPKARTPNARARQRAVEPAGLLVAWIDWHPDPAPPEGAPPPESKSPERRAEEEAQAPPPPITTLERFVQQRLPGWELGPGEPARGRGEYRAEIRSLTPESTRSDRTGWSYAYQTPRRTIALIGMCDELDRDRQVRIWETMAKSLRIEEPKQADLEDLSRYYARRSLLDPEHRISVRSKLVRGWDFEDLDHYILVEHVADDPLVRRIGRDIEAIRKEYQRLFPPAGEIRSASTVRVCRDRAEYLNYGGMPGSAGYWNSATEELVLYDAVQKEKGRRPVDDDTFIVLYHEAFHQYIHYASGELPLHSWFNEGYGDYFSGARIRRGKLRSIGPNPWRLGTIQRAIAKGVAIPWREIIHYEKEQYYANPAVCYAQGWSMIYFLNNAPAARKDAAWSRILPRYFDTLKAAYAEELDQRGDPYDPGQREAAGKAARERAVAAAFEGVDLDAIEAAWADYTLGLELD